MGVLRDKKAFFVFLMPGLLFYLLSVFIQSRSRFV